MAVWDGAASLRPQAKVARWNNYQTSWSPQRVNNYIEEKGTEIVFG